MATRLRTDRSLQNSTRNKSKNTSEGEEDGKELFHAKRIYDKKDLIRSDFNISLQGSIDTESNRMNEGKFKEILDTVVAENVIKHQRHESIMKRVPMWDGGDVSEFRTEEVAKASYFHGIAQSMTAFEFNRFRISFNQAFTLDRLLAEPALIYDKLMFLEESLKIISQQLVREGETNEHLKKRVHELILEKSWANSKKASTENDLAALEKRFNDLETIKQAATYKYQRTNLNLVAMKNEIRALKSREKQFFIQKDEHLHHNRVEAEDMEDIFSKTLIRLEDTKNEADQTEERYSKTVQKEQAILKDIMDTEKTVRYINIMEKIERDFILKNALETVSFKNVLPTASPKRKRNKSMDKKLEFRRMIDDTFLTISNMNAGSKQQFRSQRRQNTSMPNLTESDGRKSERLNTSADVFTMDRDKFISQINEFAEKNKDGASNLIEKAIEKYREMNLKYQGLQVHYLDLVYESNQKELLLEELITEIESLKEDYKVEQQISGLKGDAPLSFEDQNNIELNLSNLNKNSVESPRKIFTNVSAAAEKSEADYESFYDEKSEFLFSSYEYFLDVLTRFCNTLMASNEISQKEPTALNQKVEELTKFLIGSKRFISRAGKQSEDDIIKSEAAQKKLAKIFMDRVDNLRNQNDPKLTALEDDVLKELNNDDDSKDQERGLDGQLRRLTELETNQPRTKSHFQNLFKNYFPEAEAEANEFSKIVSEDLVLKQFAHDDMINRFLNEQAKLMPQGEKSFHLITENIAKLKDEAFELQQQRFIYIIVNIGELLLLVMNEKNDRHKFMKEKKKLTLASWLRDLTIQKSDEEYNPEFVKNSVQNKIENLIKYQDYEAFEEKERIRKEVLMRREDEMTALLKIKQKEVGDIAIIRDRITDLARDNRRKVWQTYAEFSRRRLPKIKTQQLLTSIAEQKKNPIISKMKAPIKDADMLMHQFTHNRRDSRNDNINKRIVVMSNAINDEVVELDYIERMRQEIRHSQEMKLVELIANDLREKEKNNIVQRLMPKQKNMVKKMNEDTKILNRIGRLQKITSSSEFEKKVIDAVNIPNYITDAEIPGKYRTQKVNRSSSMAIELSKIKEEHHGTRIDESGLLSEKLENNIFKNTTLNLGEKSRFKTPAPRIRESDDKLNSYRSTNVSRSVMHSHRGLDDSTRDASFHQRVLPPIERSSIG